MNNTHTDKELARSAFENLNNLMGEIHAGRIIGCLAIKEPELFKTRHPEYFVRMGIGSIMIALYKFEDLWNHQIKHLLGDQLPARGVILITQLRAKKIRQFRSLFVAHYSDRPGNPNPPLSRLEGLLKAQGFNTDIELFLWTKDVVESLEKVRDSLQV